MNKLNVNLFKQGEKKMKKYLILLTMIMTLSCLFAQTRTLIELTMYLANPDSDGSYQIFEELSGGYVGLISDQVYNAGDTVIEPYTNGSWPMGLYVDPSAIYLHIHITPVEKTQPE